MSAAAANLRIGLTQVIKTAGQSGMSHADIRAELARQLAWLIIAGYQANRPEQLQCVRQDMGVIAAEMERINGTTET